MSRYDIDFTKDTIVVDGHVFKEMINNPGVYEATDEYIAKCFSWENEDEHSDLIAVVEPLDIMNSLDMRILYIGKYGDNRMFEFANNICKGTNKITKFCYYKHISSFC